MLKISGLNLSATLRWIVYRAVGRITVFLFLYIFQHPLSCIMWNFSAPMQEQKKKVKVKTKSVIEERKE